MSAKAIVSSIVGVAVALLVSIYLYVYALLPAITAMTAGVGKTLMQNLFVIMFFLAVSLLPIALLYKAIKGGGK